MKYNKLHYIKCKELNKEYLFSYEKEDVLIDTKKVVKKSCSYLRIKCNYCKAEYDITYNSLYRKNLCKFCCNSMEKSFYYNFPNIELYNEDFEWVDSKLLHPNSNKRFYIKCGSCGNLSSSTYQLSNINSNKHYSCKFCSDGISYPNKLMINLLKILNIEYQTEVNKRTFEWCENYRYDFYIPSLKLIIEMDGNIGHGRTTPFSDGNKSLFTDFKKDKLAKENGLDIIRVDCKYDSMENRFSYIKNKIIEKLDDRLELKNVDWNIINEKSLESNMLKTWEMWNKNISIAKISNLLDMSENSVRKYLNYGNEMGKCKYNGSEEITKSNKQRVFGKKVKIIFPNGKIEVFNSIDSFLKFLNIGYTAFHNNLIGYNKIDISRIKSNSRTAKIVKEKLKPFDGCEYIIEGDGWKKWQKP